MEVSIQKTKDDYLNFYKYFYFQRNLPQRLFIIFSLALLVNTSKSSLIHANYIEKFTTIAILLFLIRFIIPYTITILRLQKAIKTKNHFLDQTKLTTTDLGLNAEQNNVTSLLKWETIKSVENSLDYIFLKSNKYRLIIPKKFFDSDDEANTFYDIIQIESIKANSLSVAKSGKHLYYWGLVGLLPNFGFIAGLILMYKGAVKYQDKKLIWIGIADVLFTIIVWIVFSYEMNLRK